MDLALKHRPYAFNDVIGQRSSVTALEGKVLSPSGTYLLHGPRGTGKTTLARIFARVVNCKDPNTCTYSLPCASCQLMQDGRHPDVTELNGANSRGIDDVRELIETSNQYPSIGKYRVFILDEIHQLTPQAQEALLKPLEEPAKLTIFCLCTTDPDKLKKTILSRCLKLPVKLLKDEEVSTLLTRTALIENIPLPDTVLKSMIMVSAGHGRDALKELTTHGPALQSGNEADIQRIAQAVEASSPIVLAIAYMTGHVKKDAAKIFGSIANTDSKVKFLEDVIECARYLIYKAAGATSLVETHYLNARLGKASVTAAAIPGLAAFMSTHVDALNQLKTYLVSDKDVCDAAAAKCYNLRYE